MTARAAAHLFGAHVPNAGGIHMAVRRASAAKMPTLQIFTAIPTYYNEKVGVRPERAERFKQALADAGIEPANVMVHAAYVINTATPDETKWTRARNGLARELERSSILGAGLACFHPGSAGGSDRGEAAERIAKAITHALETVDGSTRLVVENTAGAGRTMGRTPGEVGAILSQVPRALRPRTGYGLDTCHLFASGFDVTAGRAQLTEILDQFEEAAGEPPAFFHLNDSQGTLGSNRDRHMLIGEGEIGVEPFRWLLADRRSRGIPLILETPHARGELADDDASPDPYDVRMMKLLRDLVA